MRSFSEMRKDARIAEHHEVFVGSNGAQRQPPTSPLSRAARDFHCIISTVMVPEQLKSRCL